MKFWCFMTQCVYTSKESFFSSSYYMYYLSFSLLSLFRPLLVLACNVTMLVDIFKYVLLEHAFLG